MKASDEKASRCDHANGNQYTHLWLWSRVWGNEIPIKLQVVNSPERVIDHLLYSVEKLLLINIYKPEKIGEQD